MAYDVEYNVRQAPYSAAGDGVTDDTIPLRNCMAQARTDRRASVYVPAGVYLVNGFIFDLFNTTPTFVDSQVTIRGDGPGATILQLKSGIAGNTTIFNVRGTDVGTRATYFMLKDMTLNGNAQAARWLQFLHASQCRLERVHVKNTSGAGIEGRDWWDSVIHDCVFDNVGSGGGSGIPSVDLITDNPSDVATSSNNLKFEATRFLNMPCHAVRMNQLCRKMFFHSCLFQGLPRNAGGQFPHAYANVKLTEIFGASFTGCHFRNAGSFHIIANDSVGLVVANCSLEEAWNWAIRLDNSDNCCIAQNNFATSSGTAANGDSSLSLKGNITAVNGSTGLVKKRNLGAAGAEDSP